MISGLCNFWPFARKREEEARLERMKREYMRQVMEEAGPHVWVKSEDVDPQTNIAGREWRCGDRRGVYSGYLPPDVSAHDVEWRFPAPVPQTKH